MTVLGQFKFYTGSGFEGRIWILIAPVYSQELAVLHPNKQGNYKNILFQRTNNQDCKRSPMDL